MKTHELKTWTLPFEAVASGAKRHEIRVNDRDYQVGDVLHLREWNDGRQQMNIFAARGYSGRELYARVTYLTPGGMWGVPENLCVMSIELTNLTAAVWWSRCRV